MRSYCWSCLTRSYCWSCWTRSYCWSCLMRSYCWSCLTRSYCWSCLMRSYCWSCWTRSYCSSSSSRRGDFDDCATCLKIGCGSRQGGCCELICDRLWMARDHDCYEAAASALGRSGDQFVACAPWTGDICRW